LADKFVVSYYDRYENFIIFLLIEYEDEVQPYLDVTKSVYKELISVQKDAETQKIQVVSPVFKIEALVNIFKFLKEFEFVIFFSFRMKMVKNFIHLVQHMNKILLI
jgi:hypothetical protein